MVEVKPVPRHAPSEVLLYAIACAGRSLPFCSFSPFFRRLWRKPHTRCSIVLISRRRDIARRPFSQHRSLLCAHQHQQPTKKKQRRRVSMAPGKQLLGRPGALSMRYVNCGS
jgi:hypothetical protein